jgi:predicted dehydrogenase
VRAFCGFGRYRKIEVEDDVTAYLELRNGASATFLTSTGEAPGTNRLEVVGERGKLVYENDRIVMIRNQVEMSRFARATPQPFARPETTQVEFTEEGLGGQHVEILQNFADAILKGTPLIAPAADGLPSLELANGMLLSAWTDSSVDFPIDGRRYERLLKQKIAGSKGKTRQARPGRFSHDDFAKSFGH